jgi:hypothetical protein
MIVSDPFFGHLAEHIHYIAKTIGAGAVVMLSMYKIKGVDNSTKEA